MVTEFRKAELLPPITDLNRPYWEGLNEGKLCLQHCAACRSYQYPPETFCYACGSSELTWQETSGQGTVYSYITVHQKYHPAFFDEVPYNVSIVELDEGVRLISNVVGVPPEEVRIGLRLKVAPRAIAEGQNALYFEKA